MTYKQHKDLIQKRLGKELDGDRKLYAELLYDSLEMYYDAGSEIKKHGQVILSQINGRSFINPAVNSRNEAHKQIVKLMGMLGINPKEDDGSDDSELGGLIGGRTDGD